jgi:propanediol dehydratase small subunit
MKLLASSYPLAQQSLCACMPTEGWNLTDVKLNSVLTDSVRKQNSNNLRDIIQLLPNLDEDQQARLLIIADKCRYTKF